MLTDSFFEIRSFACDDTVAIQRKYHAVVSLNEKHPIYNGHFPGNPVVPGVCQIQIVKELVEKAVSHQLVLRESDNVKFLSMISPMVYPQLEFDILIIPVKEEWYSVNAVILSGATVFLKFKGKFESER
jgi:3-hydroxyacyl-[acyl-carrier-protein] dehydratase